MVRKTDRCSSEGYEGDLKVKVGLQHGSVHCCLLLSPVSIEHSELLYASYLFHMAPTMEQPADVY